jgi:hypothetical protein
VSRPQDYGELAARAASEGYDCPAAYDSAIRSRRELARIEAAEELASEYSAAAETDEESAD